MGWSQPWTNGYTLCRLYTVSQTMYRLWGNNMKTHREAKGVSREQMARDINSTEATLSRWEAGLVMPNDDRKIAIADYLGVPAVTLFPLVRMPS
jgi:transcriptional regulator with XRE-family HTH domain